MINLSCFSFLAEPRCYDLWPARSGEGPFVRGANRVPLGSFGKTDWIFQGPPLEQEAFRQVFFFPFGRRVAAVGGSGVVGANPVNAGRELVADPFRPLARRTRRLFPKPPGHREERTPSAHGGPGLERKGMRLLPSFPFPSLPPRGISPPTIRGLRPACAAKPIPPTVVVDLSPACDPPP